MIRRANEMTPDIMKNMRGGKGEVEVLRVLKDDEFHGKGRLFGKITLKPGTSIGLHQHVECEAFYVISGEGLYNDNGKEKKVNTGDLLYVDNKESHSIENNGTVNLELMAMILFV